MTRNMMEKLSLYGGSNMEPDFFQSKFYNLKQANNYSDVHKSVHYILLLVAHEFCFGSRRYEMTDKFFHGWSYVNFYMENTISECRMCLSR